MRVLFVTHYSGFYGANRSLLQLILGLREVYNIKPYVIAPCDGIFVNELKKNNIPYTKYKYYNWLNKDHSFIKSLFKRILNSFYFFLIKRDISRNIKTSFDIVHTNSSATNLGAYIAKKLEIPHLWHIREYGEEDYSMRYYCGLKASTKYIERNSTMIIAISKDLKKYYSEYIQPNKIRVIYNGVNVIKRSKKGINFNSPLNICFVGVISKSKNQIEVIKACEYLIKEKGVENLNLSIIGDGAKDYVDYLKQYVSNRKLDSNIKFVGYLSKVEDYLKTMDIGIISSRREAFGRVTVEYMMHRIPVIACNTGANPELINHGISGFLYKYGDYHHLAHFINRFVHDRKSLSKMGDAAYESCVNQFSTELNVENIFKCYSQVMIHNEN